MAVRITRSGVALTVGIIIIGLLVVGGLYLVKQRGEQARREDAIEVAQQNLEQSSQEGALTPGNNSGESSGSDTQSQSQTSDQHQQMPAGGSGNATTPSELPATGPTEVSALLAVALLSFSAVAYTQSRKLVLR